MPLDPSTPSVARKVNREVVVLLGWGRAILMQLAHPLVAAGVADYSGFRGGLRGYVRRTRQTVSAMLALTFGSEEEARATAARINAIHDQVNGTLGEDAGIFRADTRYSARDPHLLCWVHATLLDSLPLAYELFVGPLTEAEKDSYCAEALYSAELFGIPDGMAPSSFADLQSYMHRMHESGELHVIERARQLARALLSPPLGPTAAPLFRLARLATIGLLPPPIRDGYGFLWDERQEARLRQAAILVRTIRPLVPAILREWRAARRAA